MRKESEDDPRENEIEKALVRERECDREDECRDKARKRER